MITLQKAISIVSGEDRHNLMSLKAIVSSECPRVIKALQLIDREYTTVKKPKGYNLVKRDNKKLGFVYWTCLITWLVIKQVLQNTMYFAIF